VSQEQLASRFDGFIDENLADQEMLKVDLSVGASGTYFTE